MSGQPPPTGSWGSLEQWLGRVYHAFDNRSARSKFAGGVIVGGVLYAFLALLIITTVTSGTATGVAFAVVFASAAIGALGGFLFGIPKLADNAELSGSTTGKLLLNTNLAQVSDWLSKIVIGLGLVQFAKVLDGLQWMSGRFATIFAAPNVSAEAAAAFGISLVLTGLALGFLMMYMWTAVRLAEVLEEALQKEAEATEARHGQDEP